MRLYLLAFDHRGAFAEAIGTSSPAAIADAKELVYDAFRVVAARSPVPSESLGILVDETHAADLARRAAGEEGLLCMPVELSGEREFEFEFGDAWREHVERFDADYVKALVPWSPAGNAAQLERLAELSSWLRTTGRRLLFELVLAEPAPAAMLVAIRAVQEAGVDVAVWKLQGIDSVDDARAIATAARAGGRDDVVCTILGSGAEMATVRRWLTVAARVDGFAGFAIGRSIWAAPVVGHLAGELPRERAVGAVADAYAELIRLYEDVADTRAAA